MPREYVKGRVNMVDKDCIFCKLAGGEIPASSLYEDEKFRIILDANPATKGHALILPKQHYKNIFEIDEETLRDLIVLGKKLAGIMKERLGCDGVNLIQNNGEAAGQTVPHFHLHVLPRYADDGQDILWKPGISDPAVQEELVKKLSF